MEYIELGSHTFVDDLHRPEMVYEIAFTRIDGIAQDPHYSFLILNILIIYRQ